jgi:hypothetical protein
VGFTWLLIGTLLVTAVIGYVVTFLVVGPIRGWEPAAHAGFAGALVLSVLAALVLSAGEDGRIARWVAARRRGGDR